MRMKFFGGALVVAMLLASSPRAMAANIFINDLTDIVTVTPDANFELGFTWGPDPNFPTEPEAVAFHGSWFTNSPPGYTGVGDVFFVEDAANHFSDWIHVSYNVVPGPAFAIATIDGFFHSDRGPIDEGVVVDCVRLTCVRETGAPIEVSALLHVPANLTIQVQSDFEINEVPEPATVSLLVSGLASLGLAKLRRKRS